MSTTTLDHYVAPVRDASRRLVRELGFMRATLAGTDLPASSVHALVEIGAKGTVTSAELCDILTLEKSSVSRLVRKLIEAGQVAEAFRSDDGRAKPLALTEKGRATLAAIDRFACNQVTAALENLTPKSRKIVLDGLHTYADALRTTRTGRVAEEPSGFVIEAGYRPGIIGRAVEMQARTYGLIAGFGRAFECQIAAGLAEFCLRLDDQRSGLWAAMRGSEIVGMVAIDGQDLGPDIAHLRWFIVAESLRGVGIGRALLKTALDFCDQQSFPQVHLWTFHGLDAARRLYERQNFSLEEEKPGTQWGNEVMEQKFVRKRVYPHSSRP